MSEFQCKCERPWFYAFHSTGCPDCGATHPYYMDGMNRANVDTVIACYEDAMGECVATAVNNHKALVNLLRSFESMAADRISDIEALQFEAEALLADIDNREEIKR